jgi:simple sugar transport system ATP-binding protein
MIPAFDIADNMTLPFLKWLSVGSFLKASRQKNRAQEMVSQLGIVCQSVGDGIGTLSGGNQQKVMIARWLLEPAKVLLLDEPFQGVDIGARRDIGRHIRATAKGRATLVFLAEIDEALEIADRIVVMNEGAIVGEHKNQNVDLGALVADISGAQSTDTGTHP